MRDYGQFRQRTDKKTVPLKARFTAIGPPGRPIPVHQPSKHAGSKKRKRNRK